MSLSLATVNSLEIGFVRKRNKQVGEEVSLWGESRPFALPSLHRLRLYLPGRGPQRLSFPLVIGFLLARGLPSHLNKYINITSPNCV